MLLLLLLLPILQTASTAYVPGTPGAAWSDEELRIARGKIRWIVDNPTKALKLAPGGADILQKYQSLVHSNNQVKTESIAPNAAKLVRLTFHDCIKEVNGAGCNGCMNFHGMGTIFTEKPCYKRGDNTSCSEVDNGSHPDVGPFATDNNNLFWAAHVLEQLYKNKDFGPTSVSHFSVSLFDSGKSRADLWALAGLVSVKRTIDFNNGQCNPYRPKPCPNDINESSPSCYINLEVPDFKTGRSDCVSNCNNDQPFCTENQEIHPSPVGNGDQTLSFFKDNFGFNGREVAAIMGVHTLGHPSEINSLLRHYPWVSHGKNEFNNLYYVNIVNTTNYRHRNIQQLDVMKGVKGYLCNNPVSEFIGDEYGNPFDVHYKVRSERRTNSGGPWNWNLFSKGCSPTVCAKIAETGAKLSMNSCCIWLAHCAQVPTPRGSSCTKHGAFDKNCQDAADGSGCTNNDLFLQTNMLSPDMGLYLDFKVDGDGRPVGCPGLDTNSRWLANRDFMSSPVRCEKNQAPAGDGSSMAEVMELYARDQDTWVKDFMTVFLKMLQNGVEASNLVSSPTGWF